MCNKRIGNHADLSRVSDLDADVVFVPAKETPNNQLILINTLLAFINGIRLSSNDKSTRLACERRLQASGVLEPDHRE